LAKGVAINVGVNTKPEWGGFRGPIFSDGSFEFIHIPWKPKYGMIEPRPKKYDEMPYCSYVPENRENDYVLVSPDFDNCAYASTMRDERPAPANKPIFNLKQGDYLFFYATLCFEDERGEKEGWINPKWGAYIVGLFKIDFICKSLRHILDDQVAFEAFKEYTWFKSQVEVGDLDAIVPWVKGIKGESGLLEKAIHLSSPDEPKRWSVLAIELFRTANGNKLNADEEASFRTVLICEGECLDKLLAKCILRK